MEGIYIATVIWIICDATIAYNIEERVPLIKIGTPGSLFGFSVEQHFMNKNGNPVLLVGAPKDKRASWHKDDIESPGGFYKCEINQKHECKRIEVSSSFAKSNSQSLESNSSNQWLGVSVKSQKPGGRIAVCAHRYTVRVGTSWGTATSDAGLGRCFLLDNNAEIPSDFSVNYEWTPCLNLKNANGKYDQETHAYCQAGAAVDFTNTEDEDIIIGAPGSFSWTGSLYTDQLSQANAFFSEPVWNQNAPDKDVQNSLRNSFLGFSLANGRLSSSGKHSFVSGAPRANDTGSVTIFAKEMKGFETVLVAQEVLYGEKIASAFGYELEVFDINDDGLDDLIIGAPQYYNSNKKYGGAVYIYINKGLGKIGPNATQILYGNPQSSFGVSITNLGDVNVDGVNDLAIGAPGENGGRGAVFIYHGNNADTEKGVYDEPAQIIFPEQMLDHSNNYTGFGYSLAGGLDMDGNGYPDMAVGTLSDSAVLFRSRPIINIKSKLTTLHPKIIADITRAMEVKEIELQKDIIAKFVVFDVKFCMRYISIPNTFDESVEMAYNLTLDAARFDKGLLARATFDPKDASGAFLTDTMKLNKQSENLEECKTHKAYLRNDIQDKLSPINVSAVLTTLEPKRTLPRTSEMPTLLPVISHNRRATKADDLEIHFSKNCGDDEICESGVSWNAHYIMNLGNKWVNVPSDQATGKAQLKLGKEEQLGMSFNIRNEGEDAHQAILRAVLPPELQYVNIERTEDPTFLAPDCDYVDDNNTIVECSLGNPLLEGATASIRLKLAQNPAIYQSRGFNVTVQFLTTSLQPGHDEIRNFEVQVRVEAQLNINGYPNKEQILFGGKVVGESAVKDPADAGVLIQHTYELMNSGTSPVEGVKVHVLWPQMTNTGKWLFYLLQASVKQNGGTCQLPKDYNPLKLKFHSKTDSKKPKRGKRSDEYTVEVGTKSGDVIPRTTNIKLGCPEKANCTEIVCDLGTLEKGTTKYIYLYAILWNSTFLEEYYGIAKIEVWSSAKVSNNRRNIQFSEGSNINYSVVTSVLAEDVIAPEPQLSWWIIIAASVAGIILLVGIVLLLWLCGFFKRKRYDSTHTHKAHRRKQASKKIDESEQEALF